MVGDTLLVKAWDEVIAKVVENSRGSYDFAMNPKNMLHFSKIKIKKMGETYNFSHIPHQYGLPGLISDSLPGQYGNAVLNEFFMHHAGRLPTPLEKLQILGDNTLGALTYEPELLAGKKNNGSLVMDMAELYEETKKVLYGESNFEIERIIAISNSAAGGAQPKAIVGLDPIRKKMHIGKKSDPLPDGFIHAIVKFDNLVYKRDNTVPTFYDNSGISKTVTEYVYSLLAKKCQINMPQTYLINDEHGGLHFGVERFDIKTDQGNTERIHMHSLSGLMHHNTAETTFSYGNLFAAGIELNIPYKDIENLFRIMVFNIVFANRDDHSKNFSYLMSSRGEWRAAPAYDLTFSPSKRHQMLFGLKSITELRRKDIIAMGEEYGIRNVEEIIDLSIEVKYMHLAELSRQYGISPAWCERIFNITSKIDDDIKTEKLFFIENTENVIDNNNVMQKP